MFKKILTIIAIFVASLSSALAAGSFYIGPAATYVDLRSREENYSSILPSLYAGYGTWAREWIYLALEGFVTGRSIDVDRNSNNKINLKTSYNYGLSIVPLVNLDNVVFAFGRLGYQWSKFSDLDSTHGAYHVGVGLEGNLVECWNLRGEFDYVDYRSVAQVGGLHANEFTLSLIYRFESLISSEF